MRLRPHLDRVNEKGAPSSADDYDNNMNQLMLIKTSLLHKRKKTERAIERPKDEKIRSVVEDGSAESLASWAWPVAPNLLRN